MIYDKMHTPRVQLLIGHLPHVRESLITLLKSWWCATTSSTTSPCNMCVPCRAIQDYHWAAIRWMTPEKGVYIKDDVEQMLNATQFTVDDEQRAVVVFEHADMFGISVANRLLKLLEEPPAGWFFFLLTERPDMILPTVRSRCLEQRFHPSILPSLLHPVLACFTTPGELQLPAFIRAWEQQPIAAAETPTMLDTLLTIWNNKYQESHSNNITQAQCMAVLAVLTQAYYQLPMPGGQTIFWRLMFIQITQAYTQRDK